MPNTTHKLHPAIQVGDVLHTNDGSPATIEYIASNPRELYPIRASILQKNNLRKTRYYTPTGKLHKYGPPSPLDLIMPNTTPELHPAIQVGAKFKNKAGDTEYEIVYIAPTGKYRVLAVFHEDPEDLNELYSEWFTGEGHCCGGKASPDDLDLPDVFDPTKPCWTQSGTPIEILTYERPDEQYPIVGMTPDGVIFYYTIDGKAHVTYSINTINDLTNTPPSELND